MSNRTGFRMLRDTCVAHALTVALSASGLAAAQGGRSTAVTGDYYRAGASAASAQALRNVESHHIEPGVERMRRRNFAGALQDFEFILNYFPNHPKALTLVSELCDLNWKSPQCDPEPYFERAVAANPNASQTYIILGIHLQRRKAYDRAVDAYKRSLELNPASSNAHYNLGLAYMDLKRYDLANLHAQASYALGFPLPGLRDKLTRGGHWKALPDEEVKRITTAPKKEGGTSN